jgi:hypothetical protein
MARARRSSYSFEDFYQDVAPRIPSPADRTDALDVATERDIQTSQSPLDPKPWPEVVEQEASFEIVSIESPESLLDRLERVSVSSKEAAEFDGRVRTEGFDCLAFYKSRRHRDAAPFRGNWGIFYLDTGLRYLSNLVRSAVPRLRSGAIPTRARMGARPRAISPLEWAYSFVRAHERYHFRFDIYALTMEAAARAAFYEPLSQAFRHHPSHLVEEGLANVAAYQWALFHTDRHSGVVTFARDYLRLQPHAYARFEEPQAELRAELAANLLDLDLKLAARRYDQEWGVARVPDLLDQCPEHLISFPVRPRGLRPALCIPSVNKVIEAVHVTKYLKKKPELRAKLKTTTKKLCNNPATPGLNFKPWDATHREWSVKLDDGNRAHLLQHDPANAIWQVIDVGTHKQTGHG